MSSGITPTPAYDKNGNQLTSTPATLTWNALNQPVSIDTSSASSSAVYDALGRMVQKSSGGSIWKYVYRPSGAMLAVYTASLVKGMVPLPGGGTAIYNGSGLNYIRHKDWLGSSRLATTWAHAVYAKESYAPFGETYNEQGTADRSFTGQDQNVVTGSGGTGVYDYLFRKYDPSAGRWLSPDPSGWKAVSQAAPQSFNRYAYVENDPLRMVDPTGLDCVYAGVSTSDTVIKPRDCYNVDDSGVFFDGSVTITGANDTTLFVSVSPYTDANNPYNTTSPFYIAPQVDMWDGHTFAQQVFQGSGSGQFVAANHLVQGAAVVYGSAGLSAAAAGVIEGGGAVDVAVGMLGELPHAAVGVDGLWMHGLAEAGDVEMTSTFAADWATGQTQWSVSQFSLWAPIPEAVLPAEGAPVINCITGVCSALIRGWIP